MTIYKPIIMVGTGRCGSTMFHRLLARHESVGWLSTWNEVFPTQPWLSRFSDLYRLRFLGDEYRHRSFFPKPFEAYRFWEYYLPGFSRRDRPQTVADVLPEAIEPVRAVVERILHHQGRERFLVKVTGWSRIAYFNEIFPDARFIWINREHRSVVSSWIRAGWLDVTTEPDSDEWQWGEIPDEYYRLWRELGGGPHLAAAVKIQLDLDDIRRNIRHFPERSYQVEYEELILKPKETLRPLLAFCELPWTEQFEAEIDAMTFYNPIDKWRKHLTEEQGADVVEFFRRADESRQTAASVLS